MDIFFKNIMTKKNILNFFMIIKKKMGLFLKKEVV